MTTKEDFMTQTRKSVPAIGRQFVLLEACTPNTLPLHLVAMRNNMPVLCMFLQRAHNITRTSTDDATFAKCKDSLNTTDIYGNTPLHYLALRNAFPEESANLLPSLNLLYGMGAEFDIENNAGETMRDVANSGILTCSSNIDMGGVRYNVLTDEIEHIHPLVEMERKCVIM